MQTKFKKEHINFNIIKNPFMIGPNLWWYVVELEDGVIIDKTCTSRQYFTIYRHKTGDLNMGYSSFLEKAKAGEINLKKNEKT